MSQETLRDTAEVKSLTLGQVARPYRQEVGMIRLHLCDDAVDNVVHLHVRVDCEAFFQEFIPQCRNQSRGAFEDRPFQL